MKRKISLYIADRQVDLDEQVLILFNYTAEDLTNPTIVKNSYSQQVTLKGTPNNNAIFGDYFKVDRQVADVGSQVGAGFNPSVKTPFTIFNEMGEILESGYVKLDAVTKIGGRSEYKISLYGGLGSFLYSLAYDSEGNKKTLADLDYLDSPNPESELDFVINADAVTEAWDTLQEGDEIDSKWKVVNFAPAYNGIPQNNFSADKAIVVPSVVGLPSRIVDDEGKAFTTKNGYALVTLAEAQDEWAVKDLRSYMQRPVFSMRAFLNALCNPVNNGGYTLDISDLEQDFPYGNLWMTLPMLPSVTTPQKKGNEQLTMYTSATSAHAIGRYNIVGEQLPFGTSFRATINCKIVIVAPEASSEVLLFRVRNVSDALGYTEYQSVIFLQALAYSADGTLMGGSKVKTIYNGRFNNIADICGYRPQWGDEYEDSYITDISALPRTYSPFFQLGGEWGFVVEAQDVAYYTIHMTSYTITERVEGGNVRLLERAGGLTSTPRLFKRNGDVVIPSNGCQLQSGTAPSEVVYTQATNLRSGAYITKKILLSTSHTPADYLLSFCKIFGIHMLYDGAEKAVTLLRRDRFYEDEVIDLTERVDQAKGINIRPLPFDSKWYEFALESVGGAFSDEYAQMYGRGYGIQRVNTGYDFNKETKQLLEGIVFKNAVTILDKSKYYNIITNGTTFIPSPFVDKGNVYTLWADDGETLDTDISCPPTSASVQYYNEYGHEGYDVEFARKMQFCDATRKPISGEDVLLFYEGNNTYDLFKVTDDEAVMESLNDGIPCWNLMPGGDVIIPVFQRYRYTNDWRISTSLDFGVPAELDIPSITYDQESTIFSQYWRKYLTDRFDINTKVITCKVDFRGIRVDQDLLRKFYWYGGSLWVLNAIKNYSLTTYDAVECELVQVQDKSNYITL